MGRPSAAEAQQRNWLPWGLGFRVQGFGFRVKGLGKGVRGSWGFIYRVEGLGLRNIHYGLQKLEKFQSLEIQILEFERFGVHAKPEALNPKPLNL